MEVVGVRLRFLTNRSLAWHEQTAGSLHFRDDAGCDPDICLVVGIAALRDIVQAMPIPVAQDLSLVRAKTLHCGLLPHASLAFERTSCVPPCYRIGPSDKSRAFRLMQSRRSFRSLEVSGYAIHHVRARLQRAL